MPLTEPVVFGQHCGLGSSGLVRANPQLGCVPPVQLTLS